MIRDITAADLDAVAAIYNHYVTATTVSYEETAVSVQDFQSRVQQVMEQGYPWLVAEDQGQVVGYAYAARWKDRAAYKNSVEITVYLAQDATGRGWGTQLYRALFEQLKAMGKRMVIGGISLPNPASVALHEKMGLKQVALFPAVGFKFGRWLDVGYWQGDLEQMEQI